MARKGRSKGQGTLYRRNGRGPWLASWFDHTGRRRENSTRTTDRAAAERILAKHVAGTALRREGVIDPARDRFMLEGQRPIREHVAAYIAHCEHVGQAPRHVAQKREHLARLIEASSVTRLGELTADALERRLASMKAAGLSARSLNFARQIAVAFFGWCVRTGRAESSPLATVPRQDEGRDRRRIRRPLTGEELRRLLAVAREHGREAWYLAALLAGLRRGDLQRLTWADVDFTAGTLRIRQGKASREDTVPMHEQLAEVLRARRAAIQALPTARVFPETVQNETRQLDFLRAGIARREVVTDASGEPVLVGSGGRARPLTRIVCEDDEGRVIDLHALRTTLGTQLARAGVAPQVAQRIMRHSDYRTTLKHYTVLGLSDTSKAVAQLPGVPTFGGESEAAAATGTDCPTGSIDAQDPQRFPRHTARESVRPSARGCDRPRGGAVQDQETGPPGEPDGPASRRVGSPAQPCGLRRGEPSRGNDRTRDARGKRTSPPGEPDGLMASRRVVPSAAFLAAASRAELRRAAEPGFARVPRGQRERGEAARVRGKNISPPGEPSGLTGIEKSCPQRSFRLHRAEPVRGQHRSRKSAFLGRVGPGPRPGRGG